MIGKKLLTWVGVGVLSAVTIPAIGATIHHHQKRAAAKLVSHPARVVVKTAVKPVAHFTKPTTLVAAHVVKTGKKHTKLVKHAKTASPQTAVGVLAMHGGKSSAGNSAPVSQLLAATTKVKLHH